MKVSFITLFLFFTVNICSAQILKDLGKRIKGDAEWRVRYKTDQQVAKGLDSLVELPKKLKAKKNQEKIIQIIPIQKNKIILTIQIQSKISTIKSSPTIH